MAPIERRLEYFWSGRTDCKPGIIPIHRKWGLHPLLFRALRNRKRSCGLSLSSECAASRSSVPTVTVVSTPYSTREHMWRTYRSSQENNGNKDSLNGCVEHLDVGVSIVQTGILQLLRQITIFIITISCISKFVITASSRGKIRRGFFELGLSFLPNTHVDHFSTASM